MTPVRISIFATIASLLLLLVVFELIRSRRLRERYALLWLATGVVLLVLSAWRGGLNTIAGWVGVTTYPPAVLFAVAALFILLVLLHYSTVISKLSDQSTMLAQRVALLEERLASGDAGLEPPGNPRDEQWDRADEQGEGGQRGDERREEAAVVHRQVR